MKKFIISLFLAVAAIATSHSQLVDALQEHLKFKGVPINGSLQEYVTKMKTAGFTLIKTEKDFATLQGDFAGFKNCKITVTTIKPMDLVNTINVAFPSRDEWSELESDYRQLKTMLDRANPLYGQDYAFRRVYLLTSAAESADSAQEGAIKAVQGWVDCFGKAKLAGTVFAGGVNAAGDIKGHNALIHAYEMGKAL